MKLALTGIVAGLVLAAGAALAQAPSGQTAPPRADIVKTVGDWQVRCFSVQNQNPCDQFWQQVDSRSGQREVAISIAYSPSMDRNLVVITVPLGVSIPKGLTFQTDNYTSPLLHYRVCSRDGCFVQVADNGFVESLAKSGPDAKLLLARGLQTRRLQKSAGSEATTHRQRPPISMYFVSRNSSTP